MDRENVDIILVRMDKIGDLVVSLPVDEHPALGGQRVCWFISKGLGFIADQAAPKRKAIEFKRGFSPFEYFRMYRWLRRNKPQTIVLLHCPWWVSMAAYYADVPERIGRRSQWHGFLYANVFVNQKRSVSDRHESDFNFDLIEWGLAKLGIRKTWNLTQVKSTFLRMVAPNPFGTLEARGLKTKGFRVVHPGMAGSALNWPQENYVELIQELAKKYPVVITGTKADQKYLQGIIQVKELSNIVWLVEQLKTSELLDILSQAISVTAPSTGVLHLAAALGTPCVGIYSPRKVEHPRRWGPRGINVTYLLPETAESDSFTPEVMREITVKQVLKAVHDSETRSSL